MEKLYTLNEKESQFHGESALTTTIYLKAQGRSDALILYTYCALHHIYTYFAKNH